MNFKGSARLGHYKILSPLGAGGMGEVCLAEDTSELGRTAAQCISGEKKCQESPPYMKGR